MIVWIAESARELIASGVSLDAVKRVATLSLTVGAVEVDALLAEVGRGRLPQTALAQTRQRRAAVGRLVATARAAGSAERMATIAQAAHGSQTLTLVATHVPSALFIARHRLSETLGEARAAWEAARPRADGATVEAATTLVRLLVGLGSFDEVPAVAEEATRIQAVRPANGSGDASAELWLYLGLSRSLGGETLAAIDAIERGVALSPTSPRSYAYLAAAELVAAGRVGDLLSATARVNAALSALAESRRWRGQTLVEDIEAGLVRGRIGVVLPAAVGQRAAALADLRGVLELASTASAGELGYSVPGSRELVQITASFFLGAALADGTDGHSPEADRLLRAVVALDPASDFAAAAYRLIAPGPPPG